MESRAQMNTINRLNSILDLNPATARSILRGAHAIDLFIQEKGFAPNLLKGKTLAMIFAEPSLRTRNAFERAIGDLGGQGIYFTGSEARIANTTAKNENLRDLVKVASGFNDVLLTRIYDSNIQTKIAEFTEIPFINGMCNLHHPTQALCDFLTIERRVGKIEGIKIAFVGDGTNVATSLAHLAHLLGAKFHIATPPNRKPLDYLIDGLSRYTWSENPLEAVADADVVVTDVWVPMNKDAERLERRESLRPYQVTTELMNLAKPQAFFMHNLPANRGDEVTSEVIDGPKSAVYEEALARLHIARSLLLHMLRPDVLECIGEMNEAHSRGELKL